MRFALNVPNFGEFADARVVADLARRAETAGWDGLFVWDHVTHDKRLRRQIADPWILLTAAALATSRIRLGALVTPVARRRVPKLAREVTTLDRLSGGRVIFGAGLGAPIADEFGSFGETTDPRELAMRLDEGLTALDMLWSGQPVTFRGQYVTVEDVTFLPVPVQRPRPPVWVAGYWPNKAPMRRAARWDGAVPLFDLDADREARPPSATAVREVYDFIQACRATAGPARAPFDLVVSGMVPSSPGLAEETAGQLSEAGATWWQEGRPAAELEQAAPILRRADEGPPRL